MTSHKGLNLRFLLHKPRQLSRLVKCSHLLWILALRRSTLDPAVYHHLKELRRSRPGSATLSVTLTKSLTSWDLGFLTCVLRKLKWNDLEDPFQLI